jgi:hypothetical protein
MIDTKVKGKIGKKKKLKLAAVRRTNQRFIGASRSEDASAHIKGASIDLDGVGCGITTATSTEEG